MIAPATCCVMECTRPSQFTFETDADPDSAATLTLTFPDQTPVTSCMGHAFSVAAQLAQLSGRPNVRAVLIPEAEATPADVAARPGPHPGQRPRLHRVRPQSRRRR